MIASMGKERGYSQFPYPLQNEVIFQKCQLRCGKLHSKRMKDFVISRNCLYYYPAATIGDKDCVLPTGVLPLVNLKLPEKRLIHQEKCEVIVRSLASGVTYIRIVNEKEVKRKEKKEFCFVFGMYKVIMIYYA